MRWMWIDRIVELVPEQKLVAIKNISLAEEHLHDHFEADGERPAMPIMPASLMIEGMAQTSGILAGHARGFKEKVALAKVARAEIGRDATPGCTIRYTATLDRIDDAGASCKGTVELLDHAKGGGWDAIGRIDLMFSHVDQNMAGIEFPEENFVFTDSFRTLLRTSGIPVDF